VREAIEDVIIRYAWAYDEGEVEVAAGLFTADGTLEVSVPGVAPAVGREAISGFLGAAREGRRERGEQPRHLVNNVRIVASAAGEAQVVSYMTLVVTHADGRAVVDCAGTYTDRFVLEENVWKLARRRIDFDRDRDRVRT